MNISLHGKTAFVCGSTQGIGKAAAAELAGMGARIVLIARNAELLAQIREELDAINHLKNDFIAADFFNPQQLHDVVQEYLTKHGAGEILVNNTGGPPAGNIAEAKSAEFLTAFNSHLLCNHLLSGLLIPHMKSSGFGRIINVISTSVKQPLKGLGVSNTIRAAVANWAKTLSLELAPFGITVNNILPGATETVRLHGIIGNKSAKTNKPIDDITHEMLAEIPAGRFAQPHEIGAAIGFLASPAAAYITGINLPVDGGRTGCL